MTPVAARRAYSAPSAVAGSTLEARQAGRAMAASAMTPRRATALANSYFVILWLFNSDASGAAMTAVRAWTPNVMFLVIGSALLLSHAGK
jgi:hypothetical protein